MSTIGDQIVLAMVAALNVGTPVGIPEAELDRYEDVELTPAAPKRNLVYQVKETETPGDKDDIEDCPIQLHEMVVGFRQCALAGATTTPAQEADRIRVWNVKALTDQRFGGLAHYCRPYAHRWIRPKEPVDRKQVELESLWLVKFQSRAGNAELAA